MNDLIDRQAAIKGKMNLLVRCDDDKLRFKDVVPVEYLQNMPSAEPDLDEWCTDCSEYDHEKHCCPRFNRVIKSALNDAEPKMSRIEQELHGKTPEEQYSFLYWLMFRSAVGYSNSSITITEWLRGEDDVD